MNYDLLEELYHNGMLGDEKLYKALKEAQKKSGIRIFEGVRCDEGLHKKRNAILSKLKKRAVVDISVAGETGILYIDQKEGILTFKFEDLEAKYFVEETKVDVRAKGQNGYYIIVYDLYFENCFYFDDMAIETYRKKVKKMFPSSEDLEKEGILPERNSFFHTGREASSGALKIFCYSFQDEPDEIIGYIRSRIEFWESLIQEELEARAGGPRRTQYGEWR